VLERNFAVSLVNDIYTSRKKLVKIGNSLLIATKPNLKAFKEAFKKEVVTINELVTILDLLPIL
jgi:hypothetical protein